MAAPFVPVPFPVVKSCNNKRGSPVHTSTSSTDSEPPPPDSSPWVRVGPWGAVEESQSGPQGGGSDGSPSLLGRGGGLGGSWLERPFTPTLLGYEILEERAKFTVYKILVTSGGAESWVIFRRYTDFCRLNDKLKELFPGFRLSLPPKRWFRDNYSDEFLEERQLGLQTFLQNMMLHKDVLSSEAVRRFLCLVDPPSPFDSLEESRAFCETLEETNHRLQMELWEKQREVDTLKKKLAETENHISLLEKGSGVAEGICTSE